MRRTGAWTMAVPPTTGSRGNQCRVLKNQARCADNSGRGVVRDEHERRTGPVVDRSGRAAAGGARLVPELATEPWERLEDGEEVRLAPALEPAWGALAWWAWAPAAAAAVVVAGASALAVGAGLALAERAVALRVAHARRVRLDRAGIAVRAGRRGRVIPWSRVEVAR